MRALKPFASDGEDWSYPDYGYDELIASFEYEVLGQLDTGSYQGDTQVLLRDGDRYGYLLFGWGSCSGCDAMADCRNVAQATELRDELVAGITWFDTAAELLSFLENRDWDLQWLGDEGRKIVPMAREVL